MAASNKVGASKSMKNFLFLLFLMTFCLAPASFAQKPVEPPIQRDPVLEGDAKHNLDVAKQYFKLKKAYKAVIERLEETIAAYPEFSKMDEVLYYAGMSSYYLSQGKGKQKVEAKTDEEKKKYDPEKLRDDAIAYFSMLIEQHPQSDFRNDAEKALKEIKDKPPAKSGS